MKVPKPRITILKLLEPLFGLCNCRSKRQMVTILISKILSLVSHGELASFKGRQYLCFWPQLLQFSLAGEKSWLHPATDLNRWFSLVSMWPPWICPRQGKTHFELDKKALLCSFLSLEGKHLVLLAISGIDDVMTLFTSVDGGVNLHVCIPLPLETYP